MLLGGEYSGCGLEDVYNGAVYINPGVRTCLETQVILAGNYDCQLYTDQGRSNSNKSTFGFYFKLYTALSTMAFKLDILSVWFIAVYVKVRTRYPCVGQMFFFLDRVSHLNVLQKCVSLSWSKDWFHSKLNILYTGNRYRRHNFSCDKFECQPRILNERPHGCTEENEKGVNTTLSFNKLLFTYWSLCHLLYIMSWDYHVLNIGLIYNIPYSRNMILLSGKIIIGLHCVQLAILILNIQWYM